MNQTTLRKRELEVCLFFDWNLTYFTFYDYIQEFLEKGCLDNTDMARMTSKPDCRESQTLGTLSEAGKHSTDYNPAYCKYNYMGEDSKLHLKNRISETCSELSLLLLTRFHTIPTAQKEIGYMVVVGSRYLNNLKKPENHVIRTRFGINISCKNRFNKSLDRLISLYKQTYQHQTMSAMETKIDYITNNSLRTTDTNAIIQMLKIDIEKERGTCQFSTSSGGGTAEASGVRYMNVNPSLDKTTLNSSGFELKLNPDYSTTQTMRELSKQNDIARNLSKDKAYTPTSQTETGNGFREKVTPSTTTEVPIVGSGGSQYGYEDKENYLRNQQVDYQQYKMIGASSPHQAKPLKTLVKRREEKYGSTNRKEDQPLSKKRGLGTDLSGGGGSLSGQVSQKRTPEQTHHHHHHLHHLQNKDNHRKRSGYHYEKSGVSSAYNQLTIEDKSETYQSKCGSRGTVGADNLARGYASRRYERSRMEKIEDSTKKNIKSYEKFQIKKERSQENRIVLSSIDFNSQANREERKAVARSQRVDHTPPDLPPLDYTYSRRYRKGGTEASESGLRSARGDYKQHSQHHNHLHQPTRQHSGAGTLHTERSRRSVEKSLKYHSRDPEAQHHQPKDKLELFNKKRNRNRDMLYGSMDKLNSRNETDSKAKCFPPDKINFEFCTYDADHQRYVSLADEYKKLKKMNSKRSGKQRDKSGGRSSADGGYIGRESKTSRNVSHFMNKNYQKRSGNNYYNSRNPYERQQDLTHPDFAQLCQTTDCGSYSRGLNEKYDLDGRVRNPDEGRYKDSRFMRRPKEMRVGPSNREMGRMAASSYMSRDRGAGIPGSLRRDYQVGGQISNTTGAEASNAGIGSSSRYQQGGLYGANEKSSKHSKKNYSEKNNSIFNTYNGQQLNQSIDTLSKLKVEVPLLKFGNPTHRPTQTPYEPNDYGRAQTSRESRSRRQSGGSNYLNLNSGYGGGGYTEREYNRRRGSDWDPRDHPAGGESYIKLEEMNEDRYNSRRRHRRPKPLVEVDRRNSIESRHKRRRSGNYRDRAGADWRSRYDQPHQQGYYDNNYYSPSPSPYNYSQKRDDVRYSEARNLASRSRDRDRGDDFRRKEYDRGYTTIDSSANGRGAGYGHRGDRSRSPSHHGYESVDYYQQDKRSCAGSDRYTPSYVKKIYGTSGKFVDEIPPLRDEYVGMKENYGDHYNLY